MYSKDSSNLYSLVPLGRPISEDSLCLALKIRGFKGIFLSAYTRQNDRFLRGNPFLWYSTYCLHKALAYSTFYYQK